MGGTRKQFLELSGAPVLLRAVGPFLATEAVVAIVVALPVEVAEDPPPWLTRVDPRIRVVRGGDSRSESVERALAALPPEADIVLVHDGVRPLLTSAVVDRCIRAAMSGQCVVAGWPAVDTLKEVDDRGRIVATPERARYWHAQTPQAFPREILATAYRRASEAGVVATDDAALVERLGGVVTMVEGSPRNIKVTRTEDLALAELLLQSAPADE